MIKLENVSKFYKTESSVAVGMQKINLELKLGEFVAITGESGSGKSTLLNVISGIDMYEDGEVYINGEETSHFTMSDWESFRSANIGFIFQNYNIIDSYTVLQNVMLALEIQGYDKSKIKERATELITKVGLKSHLHHKASKLSGGQKQRCVIARALAKDCPILIADEPTGNLDSKSGESIIKLLHEVSKDKLVLLVTHNYAQAEKYVTRKIKMHDGQIVEDKKFKSNSNESTMQTYISPKKLGFSSLLKMSFRNLFATPKRFVFSLAVQIVIMTALILIYTSQMMSIRTIYTGYYNNVFSYQTENYVILQKYDNNSFTEAEINNLKQINNVKQVVPNFSAFYNRVRFQGYDLSIIHAENYTKASLIKGELPRGENEILLTEALEEYYNTMQTISFSNSLQTIEKEVKVVGIIPASEYGHQYIGLTQDYFEDDNVILAGLNQITSVNFLFVYNSNNNNYLRQIYDFSNIYVDNSVPDNTIAYPFSFYVPLYTEEENWKMNLYASVAMIGDTAKTNLEILNADDFISETEINKLNEYMVMNETLYNEMFKPLIKTNIVTLIAEDYFSATNIVAELDNSQYKILYPYMIKDFFTKLSSLFQSVFAIVILVVVGLFGYAIVHWMLKNVMQAKKKDFAIFRTIGANEKSLAWLVVIEQIIIGLISLSVTLITLLVLKNTLSEIAYQLRFIRWYDYFVLFVTLLGFSTFLGFKFNKNIFKQSVINTLNSN